MATKKNTDTAPKPALIAESKEAADAYLATHDVSEEDVTVVLVGKAVPAGANVSRVRLTPGMIRHPERVALTRAARAAAAPTE